MTRHLHADQLAAVTLLTEQGVSRRDVAERTGVSRSMIQRLKKDAECVALQDVRRSEGVQPLPAGHPLSWQAISERPFELGSWS